MSVSSTNCVPMIFIASRIAARIAGSPARPTVWRSMRQADSASCSRSRTTLPVSSRPQAEAFTNSDWLLPTCERQSPLPSLSRIRRSAVTLSGTRSSASARHISTTPSRLDSEYSLSSALMPAR